jgi:hypothetical protein
MEKLVKAAMGREQGVARTHPTTGQKSGMSTIPPKNRGKRRARRMSTRYGTAVPHPGVFEIPSKAFHHARRP